jgi:FkbM family methyltransferase
MIKSIVKRIFSAAGYEIRRKKKPRREDDFGQNAFQDMRKLTGASRSLVVIDAGANEGQSIDEFRIHLDHPIIHAFEPGTAFPKLQIQSSGIPDLYLNNFALGSESGEMDLIGNEYSYMSSLLEPSVDCWGAIREPRKVPVKTLDEYCAVQGITHIDILKSDTQGFDLEVVKGATRLLINRRIHLVYMEVIFSDMYKGLPSLGQIYRFMTDHGFHLVAFYQFYFQHDRAAWTDALFVNPEFKGLSLFGVDKLLS